MKERMNTEHTCRRTFFETVLQSFRMLLSGSAAPHDRWSLLSVLQLMIIHHFLAPYWIRDIFNLLPGIDQRYLCVVKERLYDS